MSQGICQAVRGWFFIALLFLFRDYPFSVPQAAPYIPEERPNILLILTDQQHAGMMSCAGNQYLTTPAMDSLAHNGARFELAYCCNPVCAPSRVSILTGVMPGRIGVEHNDDMPDARVSEVLLRNSLGRVFRQAGYQTAYGGKVHLAPIQLDEVGFDCISRDQRTRLAEDCAAFLRQEHDRPFLLVASFINPHDICYMAIQSFEQAEGRKRRGMEVPSWVQPLEEALKLPAGMSAKEFYGPVCPPLPANFEIPLGEPEAIMYSTLENFRDFRIYVRRKWSAEQWRLHRWAYCRLTERVDQLVATVLQALRESGLEENTLIVFSSDHGDMDSAHRLEHKAVLYEEAIRVPLIVSFKGVTEPGLVNRQHLVSTGLDLIPTLCDFAGIPVPEALVGRSLRPLAERRVPEEWRTSLVVESKPSRMIRTARFKYCVYGYGEPREMLIDLEQDPGEMRNLAENATYKKVLNEHRKLLRDWYRENGEKLPQKYILGTR